IIWIPNPPSSLSFRLLVGAPKAQTSQQGITEAGAVFRCRINRQECYIVPFDVYGNEVNKLTLEVDENKSHEWFGASLKSSGKNGVIAACAPRYIHFYGERKREPVGRCIVKKPASRTFDVHSPCKGEGRMGFHKIGHCQAGMAVSLTSNGVKLLIGSPGSFYWQGQIHDVNLRSNVTTSTKEGPLNNDDMYMGYSTAVGEFNGDQIQDYVVGAPKAEKHYGKVMIYTQELIHIQSILGEQFGEYFGHAIEAADLNGDRLDDIIVGAPMHSNYEDASFEVGCIYIYYQSAKHTFHRNDRDIITGKTTKSRFGWTFATLKDINYDGYQDFATSAPYGGKDGKGAVYIFHGSKNGVNPEPSQVIDASDLKHGLRTFGYSLSGGMDLDGNSYTDLLVGAYGSDKTAFFRARPVVTVVAEQTLYPEVLNLDKQDCHLLDRSPRTCMRINTEISYHGVNLPPKLRLEVTWTLDTLNNKTQRVFYLENNAETKTQTFVLLKSETKTFQHQAYLKENIRDKLTPVGVKLEYKIKDNSRRRKRDLTPILNKYIEPIIPSKVQILKDCGFDFICIPELELNVPRTSSQQIIGNNKNLEIQIKVENHKDDAFETQLYVTLPANVTYAKVQDVKSKTTVGCKAASNGNLKFVVCELGNPLKKKQKISLVMKFSPKDVTGLNKYLDFQISVNSSNPENSTTTRNNFRNVSIPVKAAADIIILGKSTPDQVIYNSSQGDEIRESYMYNNTVLKHGPSVEHLYEVRNKGYSDVSQSILKIQWPSYDINGNPLLELIGVPNIISDGEGSCKVETAPPIIKEKVQFRNTRKKREANEKFLYTLNCTDKWCSNITCELGYLQKGDSILVQIRSKLWTSTLLKMEYLDKHQIVSKAKLVVTDIPYNIPWDPYDFPTATKELYTQVNPEKLVPKSRPVPIWVIAIAVAAGILLLFLLIVLLWWCGFFKRVKPEDMKEMNGDTYQ
ncbi:integrin alpha-8-like isoform X3, partial [Argonauta hians]